MTDRKRKTGNRPRGPAPGGRRFVTTTVEIEGREETRIVEIPAFEPTPWDRSAKLSIVGQRIPRVDALEKVTGRARYTTDVHRPGMLYAMIARSIVARGRVTALDLAAARRVPGVVDVVSAAEVPEQIQIRGLRLFSSEVRYAGQPLAAVCAESEDAARAGVEALAIRYETAPFAATFAHAVALGAPSVRGGANLTESSPEISERGDVDRGVRESDVMIHRVYRTPVAMHTALEPHGTVADWDGERLTVWESTQGIFHVREHLATGLGLPMTSVRVIKEYMGGGFGAKNGAGPHTYAAAILSRRLGRPVRCVNDREAEQMDAGNRPATVQRVTLAAKKNGRLTAIVVDADIPLGIGGYEGGPGKIYHELYSCPNVRSTETFAYINAGAMSAFRGPGHVEGAFGLECAMETLARELKMDPLELRLINYAKRDEEKDRPYSSNGLKQCYAEGAKRFGWKGRRRENSAGHLRRGFGMAAQIWGAGGGPPAYAICKINSDGSADVLTGTQDLGTGARTIFAQIAAEALGASLDQLRMVIGDTERTPYTGNSWGSMTTPSVGPAVRMAAEDARKQLLEAASEVMSVPVGRLSARGGVIRAKGSRKSITFRALAEELGDVMIIGRGSRGPNPDHTMLATVGVQFAEVECDLDTGSVRVIRIVAAHDGGRIINPTLAESQLEGGIIQGLGYALFEERILDARLGVPLNPTMHDYKIPTMRDIPAIDAFFIESSDPVANHTGARGIAEPPIIPTAPAIVNAVVDALAVELLEIPLTPWRVLGALAPR